MISQKQIKELYGENTGDTNITVRWNINKMQDIGRTEANKHGIYVRFVCVPEQTI